MAFRARGRNRLLVIGAATMRGAAFAAWREIGLDVVFVDGSSTDRCDLLANEYHPLESRDGLADLATLTELAGTCNGVTTLADSSQSTVAAVAERAGLPGVGGWAASIARSKGRQRSVLGERGVGVPRWQAVHEERDIATFFEAGDEDAILKPVDCAGSAGVLRVSTAAEATRHWPVVRSLSPSKAVLIETFMPGREVCVDAVILDGTPHFVSVCDADYIGPTGFIAVSARYAHTHDDQVAAQDAIQQLATALELRHAMLHAEFKIDGARWMLVECALRPGGALVPELTERVTGVSLYEAQARVALGEAPGDLSRSSPPAVVPYAQVRFLVASGQVRAMVPPIRVVDGLPDVRIVGQFAGPGRRVRQPISEEGRAGFAAGWGHDRDALDAQLQVAVERLSAQMGLTQLEMSA